MKNYLSLVKFSHTVFALPFAMIGFTLGVFFFMNTNSNGRFGVSNPIPVLIFYTLKIKIGDGIVQIVYNH
jgi:hypothetical protein